jgi:8-oxo-dGTP pyrophosphatase MutT (NUDIX family)
MEGITREALDKSEAADFALGGKPMRPRDAATLMLLDRRGADVLVLMGKRHRKHAFMPGKFVFPGGRTDPADSRVPVASPLHPVEEAKLLAGRGSGVSIARARAIAMSAIRETYEEAGLLLGEKGEFATTRAGWRDFARHGVRPALGDLRLIARAVTPPGRVRRFDTRFLAAWRDRVAVELKGGGPTGELEELVWLRLQDAVHADVPLITKTVLTDLGRRLETDPDLTPGAPAPFYFMRYGRFVREIL